MYRTKANLFYRERDKNLSSFSEVGHLPLMQLNQEGATFIV